MEEEGDGPTRSFLFIPLLLYSRYGFQIELQLQTTYLFKSLRGVGQVSFGIFHFSWRSLS